MTWPTSDVNTTNMDSDTDSPLAARADIKDMADKLNQIRNHVTPAAQDLLDDATMAVLHLGGGAETVTKQVIFAANPTILSVESGTGSGPYLILDRQQGAGAGAGHKIGAVVFNSKKNNGTTVTYGSNLMQITDSGDSIHSGKHIFEYYRNGALISPAMTLGGNTGGLVVGVPTGGEKGDGNINASTIYENNVRVAKAGANTDITSLTGITGDVTSTKACVAGYVRVGPNLCMKTSSEFLTALTRDTPTALTNPSLDSKALIISYYLSCLSANVVGARFTELSFSSNALVQIKAIIGAYEFSALSSQVLAQTKNQIILVKNTDYVLTFNDDSGNQGSASYDIRGYYD